MSEKNNTTNVVKKQYHHLTKDDRVKIETLISLKDSKGKRLYSNTYIANEIGVDKATISRELRNRIKSKISVMTGKVKNKPYNAIDAQNDYKYKRAMSKAEYKLEKYPKMKKFIEDKILNDKWAPDVIVGYMKKHNYFKRKGFSSITMQTIYNAIRYNIIDVKVDDMRRMKYNPKYEYNETPEVKESKRDYTIEKRDKEIDKRLVFGHFELDTVLGKRDGVHECLMTITERKTRYEMIFKLSSKSADEVIHKFNQIKDFMKKNFDKVFKTITTDNGTEFSEFKEIIKDTKAKIYFCHPYCSGEKGSNERNNEIIRYFIPKSTLIENYSYVKNLTINLLLISYINYKKLLIMFNTLYSNFLLQVGTQ